MTLSRDLFLSILSMDAYNRGYGVGVRRLPVAGNIGNATILTDAISELDARTVVASGFYAIAYDMTGVSGFASGERVISYRGTNYDESGNYSSLRDTWNGWTLGAGFPEASQGFLSLDFYRTVTGRDAVKGSNNVTLTGHSLGGGLAGFVGALSGEQTVMFDHMPFLVAAAAQFFSSYRKALDAAGMSLDTEPTDEVLNQLGLVRPNTSQISGYFLEGEINRTLRDGSAALLLGGIGSFVPVLGPALAYLGAWIAGGQISESVQLGASIEQLVTYDWDKLYDALSFDRHSMATLVIAQYAREQEAGDASFYNWRQGGVSNHIYNALYDNEIAAALQVDPDLIGEKNTAVGVMRTAIAYSAIDEGTDEARPFGDVAIRAMFDDAADFGRVLQSGALPQWLGDDANAAIGRVIVEFAGLMALRDAQRDTGEGLALNGVITNRFTDQGFLTAMRINFDEALWALGGDMHQSAERETLVNALVDATLTGAQLERAAQWYSEENGGSLLEAIDEVVFGLTQDAILTPTDTQGMALTVLGDTHQTFIFDDSNHFVISGDGGAGNDNQAWRIAA